MSRTGDGGRWFERAAFLGERVAVRDRTPPSPDPPAADLASLERRWSRSCAAGRADRFERRLAALGLARTDLGPLAEPVRWPEPPAWVQVTAEVAARARADGASIDWDPDAAVPFASLLRPWIDWAVDRLRHRVDRDLVPLIPSLEQTLTLRLRRCGEPAILEVYRSSELGYRAWVGAQRADGFDALLDELPVWGRLSATAVAAWVESMTEFFGHLDEDEALVRSELLGGDRGAVVAIRAAGDPHNGGRQVVVVGTATGGAVVYKPRSLRPEAVVADACRHLRDAGGLDFDPVPDLIDRTDHGWMRWVPARPPDVASSALYSRRAGAVLAVARALAITDLHDENVVPSHDRPQLVDLECLATSRPNDRSPTDPASPQPDLLDRSVLSTDLLMNPVRFGRDGRDCSGLTGFQITGMSDPIRTYVWTGLGTDDISLDRPMGRAEQDEPIPHLDLAALLGGLAHTEEVIARVGLGLDPGRRVDVRVLVQDTAFYATVLDRSLTRRALSDGLAYSVELDQVAAAATSEGATSWRLSAAEREREQLEEHDIPLFTVDWNETGGALGALRIADLVDEPGTLSIGRRRADSTPDRRRLQLELTALTLRSRIEIARDRAGQDVGEDAEVGGAPAPAPTAVLDVCRTIGAHLERTAIHDDAGGLCWVDIDHHGSMPVAILTDHGLGTGNAGVAIFLAGLARLAGETRWADLATRSLSGEPTATDPSLYLGASGRGYALVCVGRLVEDQRMVERGRRLLRALPGPEASGSKQLDVLFGLPGIAGATAAAALMTGDEDLAAMARARAAATEVCWRDALAGGPRSRTEALRIGAAHGITGIELCMSRVYELDRDPGVGAWIEEMVAVENERVDRRGGVPARLDAVDRQPDRGWCWGVAGYVMARRAVAAATGLAAAGHGVAEGAALAMQGEGRIDRLCCGRAAQAEVTGRDNPHLARLASRVLGWEFERDHPHQNASLLRGVAGVGVTLLRAADPGRVPQPLTLDPVA